MIGQAFQIQHLPPQAVHSLQQFRFGAPSVAIQRDQAKRQRLLIQIAINEAPVTLIAALNQASPPTDLAQHPRKTARTLPAPPAIDQRTPAAVMMAEAVLNTVGGIAKHQSRPQFTGLKGAVLHIDCAHLGPLFVAQHWQVNGAGNMIFGKFRRAAHINDRIITVGQDILQGFVAIGHGFDLPRVGPE